MLPEDGRVELSVASLGSVGMTGSGAWVEIRVDGARQAHVRFLPGGSGRISFTTSKLLVFVELRATSADGKPLGARGSMDVDVFVGRVSRGLCYTCP